MSFDGVIVLVFWNNFGECPHLSLHLSDMPPKRWVISQGHSFRLLSRSDENCSSSKTSVLSRDTWCDTPTPSIFKSSSVDMLADSPISIIKRNIVSYVNRFYLHDQRLKTSAPAIISFFVNHWHCMSCKFNSIKWPEVLHAYKKFRYRLNKCMYLRPCTTSKSRILQAPRAFKFLKIYSPTNLSEEKPLRPL